MTITLTITFDTKTSAVTVNGPLNDRLLCYGLLEEARAVVAANAAKAAAQPAIVRATELPHQ